MYARSSRPAGSSWKLGSLQGLPWPVDNRQVLDGAGMAVLQPGIADATAGEVPSAADGLDGLERTQPLLAQSIEGVATPSIRPGQRQLFHPEVFR